jgi:hypothetical protein
LAELIESIIGAIFELLTTVLAEDGTELWLGLMSKFTGERRRALRRVRPVY